MHHLARYEKASNYSTLIFPKYPLFSTKRNQDLNYPLTKHRAPGVLCAWQSTLVSVFLNKEGEEWAWDLNKIQDQTSEKLREVLEPEELQENNKRLQQELSACQHSFDDNEMKNGRHRRFNFKLSKLSPHEITKFLKIFFKTQSCCKKELGSGIDLAKCKHGHVFMHTRSRDQNWYVTNFFFK